MTDCKHYFPDRSVVPSTDICRCELCGAIRKGWIEKTKPVAEAHWFDGRSNTFRDLKPIQCYTCGKPRAIPDPTKGDGPVTEPFPDWACPEIYCGDISENDGASLPGRSRRRGKIPFRL